jgi:hypothetical protein
MGQQMVSSRSALSFMRDQLLGDAEKALKRAVRAYRIGNVETAEDQLFFHRLDLAGRGACVA